MENEELPQYMRIAVSVAGRIADGQLAEGEKLSGRSKLSSEYQVSPETIRKSVQLLRDMQVVTVKEQSGVYVRSAENAKRYLQMVGEKNELRQKKQRLRALLAQQEAVARQVSELCGSILDDSVQPEQAAEQLPNYSCPCRRRTGPDAGKNLGALPFLAGDGGDGRRDPRARNALIRLAGTVCGACMRATASSLWATRRHARSGRPVFFGNNTKNMIRRASCVRRKRKEITHGSQRTSRDRSGDHRQPI